MKSNYEQTLDENFNKALELCSKHHTHEDLIFLLQNGNIAEKQYAALELNELRDENDTAVFLSNLINCDGKIREAVAQKFSEFVLITEYREYFSNYPEIFAKSTIDINANISRMVIEGLDYMTEYTDFGTEYADNLKNFIYESFDGLDKIVYKDKKYTINKQLFKLYWCLEGLNNYYKYLPTDDLIDILNRSVEIKEYTIREKCAQIILKQTSDKFNRLKSIIKNDDNYYVKKQISG